jgi:hypothetical protein
MHLSIGGFAKRPCLCARGKLHWRCTSCTWVNPPARTFCEVCDSSGKQEVEEVRSESKEDKDNRSAAEKVFRKAFRLTLVSQPTSGVNLASSTSFTRSGSASTTETKDASISQSIPPRVHILMTAPESSRELWMSFSVFIDRGSGSELNLRERDRIASTPFGPTAELLLSLPPRDQPLGSLLAPPRDPLLGTPISVVNGPFKGYSGTIESIVDNTTLRVTLGAAKKTVLATLTSLVDKNGVPLSLTHTVVSAPSTVSSTPSAPPSASETKDQSATSTPLVTPPSTAPSTEAATTSSSATVPSTTSLLPSTTPLIVSTTSSSSGSSTSSAPSTPSSSSSSSGRAAYQTSFIIVPYMQASGTGYGVTAFSECEVRLSPINPPLPSMSISSFGATLCPAGAAVDADLLRCGLLSPSDLEAAKVITATVEEAGATTLANAPLPADVTPTATTPSTTATSNVDAKVEPTVTSESLTTPATATPIASTTPAAAATAAVATTTPTVAVPATLSEPSLVLPLSSGTWQCLVCTVVHDLPMPATCPVCDSPTPKPATSVSGAPAKVEEKIGWTCEACTMFNKSKITPSAKCSTCGTPIPKSITTPPPPAPAASIAAVAPTTVETKAPPAPSVVASASATNNNMPLVVTSLNVSATGDVDVKTTIAPSSSSSSSSTTVASTTPSVPVSTPPATVVVAPTPMPSPSVPPVASAAPVAPVAPTTLSARDKMVNGLVEVSIPCLTSFESV